MNPTSVHTRGTISDYFALETHILSTRSADAYRSVDKTAQTGVTLWILRHALGMESESARRFIARLEKIKSVSPPIASMLSYGVDATGIAFAVFNPLDGFAIGVNIREQTEAERRFLSAVRQVDRLHQAGIVCGDLCGGSFWVDRGGEVRFVGVMGSFDTEAAHSSMLPPADTLHYLSPEQANGEQPTPQSDVFALGVLAYHLLSRHYPFSGGREMRPLPEVMASPPAWSAEVIARSLASDPADRYQNAGELFQDIQQARERATHETSMPVRSRADLVRGQPAAAAESTVEEPESDEKPARTSGRKMLVLGGAAAAGAVLVGIMMSGGGASGPEDPLASEQRGPVHEHVDTNQQLQQALKGVGSAPDAVLQNDRQIEVLVKSDDPLAHDALVRLALEATVPQARQRAEKGLIDRARRLGLVRCAEEIRAWLQSLPAGAAPPSYEPLLRALDPSAPLDARQRFLRQAYVHSPATVLRFTAGFGFDTQKLAEYQPLLAQLVGDNLRLDDAAERSAFALVLADPVLSPIYADDVIQNLNQVADKDIPWLLQIMASRKDVNIKPIANVAIDRNLLSPIRRVFAQLLRDRDNLTPAVSLALVNAVAGAVSAGDIARFGEWYDMDSERVLFAILADTTDPALLVEGFDTVAGKSLSIQPSADLLDLVRQKYWDRRAELAQSIGIFSSPASFTPAELDAALTPFDRLIEEEGTFLDIFFEVPHPLLIQATIKRWGQRLGPGRLLSLLSNPEKEIRLLAISRLKDFNHAQLLKLIIEAYERERDPEVQQAYHDAFWFIRDRTKAF